MSCSAGAGPCDEGEETFAFFECFELEEPEPEHGCEWDEVLERPEAMEALFRIRSCASEQLGRLVLVDFQVLGIGIVADGVDPAGGQQGSASLLLAGPLDLSLKEAKMAFYAAKKACRHEVLAPLSIDVGAVVVATCSSSGFGCSLGEEPFLKTHEASSDPEVVAAAGEAVQAGGTHLPFCLVETHVASSDPVEVAAAGEAVQADTGMHSARLVGVSSLGCRLDSCHDLHGHLDLEGVHTAGHADGFEYESSCLLGGWKPVSSFSVDCAMGGFVCGTSCVPGFPRMVSDDVDVGDLFQAADAALSVNFQKQILSELPGQAGQEQIARLPGQAGRTKFYSIASDSDSECAEQAQDSLFAAEATGPSGQAAKLGAAGLSTPRFGAAAEDEVAAIHPPVVGHGLPHDGVCLGCCGDKNFALLLDGLGPLALAGVACDSCAAAVDADRGPCPASSGPEAARPRGNEAAGHEPAAGQVKAVSGSGERRQVELLDVRAGGLRSPLAVRDVAPQGAAAVLPTCPGEGAAHRSNVGCVKRMIADGSHHFPSLFDVDVAHGKGEVQPLQLPCDVQADAGALPLVADSHGALFEAAVVQSQGAAMPKKKKKKKIKVEADPRKNGSPEPWRRAVVLEAGAGPRDCGLVSASCAFRHGVETLLAPTCGLTHSGEGLLSGDEGSSAGDSLFNFAEGVGDSRDGRHVVADSLDASAYVAVHDGAHVMGDSSLIRVGPRECSFRSSNLVLGDEVEIADESLFKFAWDGLKYSRADFMVYYGRSWKIFWDACDETPLEAGDDAAQVLARARMAKVSADNYMQELLAEREMRG